MIEKRRYRRTNDGHLYLVVTVDGVDGFIVEFTDSCSGCHETIDGYETGDYPYDAKAQCYVGAGCQECGHTGKRRRREWVPFDAMAALARTG
jgi:hypothetical protein